MHWTGPVVRLVLVVVAFAVLAGRPIAAGQPGPRAAGVVEAHVEDGGEHRSQPPRTGDEARGVRRPFRAPLRDPWSVGVRALWRSFGGAGGAWHPPTGSRGVPIRGSCAPSGACSAGGRSELGRPIGPVTGNRLAVQGVALDAGRLISSAVEIGAGLDLTTHPGIGFQSGSSLATPVGGLGELSPAGHAAQVLAGDRALQIDLVGRLTYRFRGDDAPVGARPVGRPYVGFGAGVSRYFPGLSKYNTPGLDAEPQPYAAAFDDALFETWTPNVQLYAGVTVRLPRIAPLLDIDFRYMRAAIHGLDLGGVRFGTGIRYPF